MRDGQTDGWVDGWMEKVTYRGGCPNYKIVKIDNFRSIVQELFNQSNKTS